MAAQKCPICLAEVDANTRYPGYVCRVCAKKAASADGRLLEFSNVGVSGGFVARYADTGAEYSSHECFIGGFKCHADEAHFGGIVIEVGVATGPLEPLPLPDLLKLYCSVLDELRRRGITRSSNNPVADYTEHLVAQSLGLTRTGNSASGHDAVDGDGRRYQIKGRRLTPQNPSTQLSAIRNLASKPFDFLIAVVYRSDFTVDYAAQVPYEAVVHLATYVAHTNSHRFLMKRSFLNHPGVVDITSRLAV